LYPDFPTKKKKEKQRGHAHIHQRHKRASGFFIAQLQSDFQFISDWYRKKEVRGKVAQYYRVVRSVLKEKPHLRKCLTRCRHCHIVFFTHPRNAGRSDLGCPFGCREAHRRKNAIDRSTAYYRTREGRQKKRYLNARRSHPSRLTGPAPDEDHGGSSVTPEAVHHIQLVTSLIEGRDVALAEITTMLDKVLRQHSIDTAGKMPYAAVHHQKSPP